MAVKNVHVIAIKGGDIFFDDSSEEKRSLHMENGVPQGIG